MAWEMARVDLIAQVAPVDPIDPVASVYPIEPVAPVGRGQPNRAARWAMAREMARVGPIAPVDLVGRGRGQPNRATRRAIAREMARVDPIAPVAPAALVEPIAPVVPVDPIAPVDPFEDPQLSHAQKIAVAHQRIEWLQKDIQQKKLKLLTARVALLEDKLNKMQEN